MTTKTDGGPGRDWLRETSWRNEGQVVSWSVLDHCGSSTRLCLDWSLAASFYLEDGRERGLKPCKEMNMLPIRFPITVPVRFFNARGRASRLAGVVRPLLASAMALTLLLCAAEVAWAELSCPPECEACNANPKCVWHQNFCFCTIDADVTVLSDLDVPDPVLT